MQDKITELKARAYDARAEYEMALHISKRSADVADIKKFADENPWMDIDVAAFPPATAEETQRRKSEAAEAAIALKRAQAAWEAAETELLNAVADETGLNDFMLNRKGPFRWIDFDSVKGAL